MLCAVYTVHKESGSTSFLVEPQSPLWFLVGEGLGLLSSSYGECMMDMRVYVVRATRA
jgi:hypothetical protein